MGLPPIRSGGVDGRWSFVYSSPVVALAHSYSNLSQRCPMLHRSGWARWRRAKRGSARVLSGRQRRSSSPRLARRSNVAPDVERTRRLSERAQYAARVDVELRVLCRTEAAARREFGCAAHLLLRQHGYRRFGFVRLSDYARERLGLSARTVQAAAWVASRLDALPAVSTAFDRSEISWTQARTLCTRRGRNR
jgi:hypothetical protein